MVGTPARRIRRHQDRTVSVTATYVLTVTLGMVKLVATVYGGRARASSTGPEPFIIGGTKRTRNDNYMPNCGSYRACGVMLCVCVKKGFRLRLSQNLMGKKEEFTSGVVYANC